MLVNDIKRAVINGYRNVTTIHSELKLSALFVVVVSTTTASVVHGMYSIEME